jgi:hypothetical protein
MGTSYLLIVGEIIMNDEMDIFFESDNGACYLESLIKSRVLINKVYSPNCSMCTKLEKLIDLELDLAIAGAEKATSELKKTTAKVTPLKGV